MTARMKLPDIEEKDKPKRRPIPDHITRVAVELTPVPIAAGACAGLARMSPKSWNTCPGASS